MYKAVLIFAVMLPLPPQDLCEILKEEPSKMEKKAIPSKECVQDLKRIVDTLEQEKVRLLVVRGISVVHKCLDLLVFLLPYFFFQPSSILYSFESCL